MSTPDSTRDLAATVAVFHHHEPSAWLRALVGRRLAALADGAPACCAHVATAPIVVAPSWAPGTLSCPRSTCLQAVVAGLQTPGADCCDRCGGPGGVPTVVGPFAPVTPMNPAGTLRVALLLCRSCVAREAVTP